MSQDGREIGKVRRFRNTRLGVRALLDDLQQLGEPARIGLEATGHYWLACYVLGGDAPPTCPTRRSSTCAS